MERILIRGRRGSGCLVNIWAGSIIVTAVHVFFHAEIIGGTASNASTAVRTIRTHALCIQFSGSTYQRFSHQRRCLSATVLVNGEQALPTPSAAISAGQNHLTRRRSWPVHSTSPIPHRPGLGQVLFQLANHFLASASNAGSAYFISSGSIYKHPYFEYPLFNLKAVVLPDACRRRAYCCLRRNALQ